MSVAVAGDGYPLKVVKRNLSNDVKNGRNCLVRINGSWYDIADYMDSHPGGDIIKEFIGKDATVMFRLWHPTHVFKHPERYVKFVSERDIEFLDHKTYNFEQQSSSSTAAPSDEERDVYVVNSRPPKMTAADERYLEIYDEAERQGYFKGTREYLNERIYIIFGFLCASFFFLWTFSNVYAHFLGALCLFWVWHQCAGIMHDTGHNQYFNGSIKKNAWYCFVFGNIGGGLSSSFWKWEHIEHHSFTASFDEELGNADPQMTEDVWLQDAQLVDYAPRNYITWMILRIQAVLFPIAVTLAARIGIVVDGFITETRWYEFAGLGLHVLWTSLLLSKVYFEFGLLYALFVYYMAAVCFCILAFQLQSNHMDKPWIKKGEEFEKDGRPLSHIHRHIRACSNVYAPRWLDWAWGGLHFHKEHHCFPRMARQYYREFSPVLQNFCVEFGYDYQCQGFFETMWNVVKKLHGVRYIRDVFDLGKED